MHQLIKVLQKNISDANLTGAKRGFGNYKKKSRRPLHKVFMKKKTDVDEQR